MKTLIKWIIALFFSVIMVSYCFIPTLKLVEVEITWYIIWLIISHCIVSVAIYLVPLIFIVKWIDKNIK